MGHGKFKPIAIATSVYKSLDSRAAQNMQRAATDLTGRLMNQSGPQGMNQQSLDSRAAQNMPRAASDLTGRLMNQWGPLAESRQLEAEI
ncbi:hypothetical protein PRIPAC_86438 [Pristionchus pacificus]|uniref:Uncharacterized protein n=1 Tax=Pristionchus pacificus TaxID=54126 RepID=A0A2A6CEQ4_PRIPA|nr:hypothetical protein PRIPAC_86438 [Pristionchus pacificus]|eukprot:PDM76596.1 hypothetical protein PRIPAC_42962 [Pristionchus pacificus]